MSMTNRFAFETELETTHEDERTTRNGVRCAFADDSLGSVHARSDAWCRSTESSRSTPPTARHRTERERNGQWRCTVGGNDEVNAVSLSALIGRRLETVDNQVDPYFPDSPPLTTDPHRLPPSIPDFPSSRDTTTVFALPSFPRFAFLFAKLPAKFRARYPCFLPRIISHRCALQCFPSRDTGGTVMRLMLGEMYRTLITK